MSVYSQGLVCLGRGKIGESVVQRARSGAFQRSATREARSFEGRRLLMFPFYSDSRVANVCRFRVATDRPLA